MYRPVSNCGKFYGTFVFYFSFHLPVIEESSVVFAERIWLRSNRDLHVMESALFS